MPLLVGHGEAVKDSLTGVFRPGGMEPRDTRRVLGHDAQALDGCSRVGEMDRSTPARAQLGRLFEVLSASETDREIPRQARLRDVRVCVNDEADLLA